MQHAHCQQLCPSSRAPKGPQRTQTLGAFRDPPAENPLKNYRLPKPCAADTSEAQCVARNWTCSLGLQQRVHLAEGKCHSFTLKPTHMSFLTRSPNKAQKRVIQPLCLGLKISCPDSSSSSSAKASNTAGLQHGTGKTRTTKSARASKAPFECTYPQKEKEKKSVLNCK